MNQAFSLDAPKSTKASRHWAARLALGYARQSGRTELTHKLHEGPLRVQRLFYPDPDGKAHTYLLHPPGGVVLGDDLGIDVTVRSGAALLTSPSAGRFYSAGSFAEEQRQQVRLRAEAGLLEWLPQETILFSGARARMVTEIHLKPGAHLAFWEVLVLGRPAAGEAFVDGSCAQDLCIYRDEQLILRERLRLSAGDRLHRSPLGLGGHSTVAVAAFTARASREDRDTWLEQVNGPGRCGPFSITQRGELLLARYLGDDAFICRRGFSQLWRAITLRRDGRAPQEPRIWHT